MKKLQNGISDYETLITDNYYYVHKTEYIEKLEDAVKKAKANKLWRKEYMTLEMRDLENQEFGKKIGEKIGERNIIIRM